VVEDRVVIVRGAGIWSGSSAATLRLLVRESDVAPGKQPGARFRGSNDDEDYFPAFGNPSINSAGQIAFSATTIDGQGNRGSGIWMSDSNGLLQAVIQVGQPFEVSAGDVRIVSSFHFNDGRSSEEGMFSASNDRGQLAFAATFEDGSEGVFIAANVPEPAGAVCGTLLLIATARRRRWMGSSRRLPSAQPPGGTPSPWRGHLRARPCVPISF
jgi:hypothetical protein